MCFFIEYFYNKKENNYKIYSNDKNNKEKTIIWGNKKKLSNYYFNNNKIWQKIQKEIQYLKNQLQLFLSKYENNINIFPDKLKTEINKIFLKNWNKVEKIHIFLNTSELYTLKNMIIKLNFETKELLEKKYKEEEMIELKLNFVNFNNIYEKILEKKIEETKTEAYEIINKIEKKIKINKNEITKDEKQKANVLIQSLTKILETSNIPKIKLKINNLWIFEQEIFILLQEIEEAKNTAMLTIKNSNKYLKLFENEFSSYQKNLIKNQIKELEFIIKQKRTQPSKIDQKTLKLAQSLEQVINNQNINILTKNKKILNIKQKYSYKKNKQINNKLKKNYFYFLTILIIINIILIVKIKTGIIKFIK